MSTVSVNARLFRAVAAFVSSDETRYYLQGVHIEPHAKGGVIMVATDGKKLMCVWDKDGAMKGENPIVKLDKAALNACKAVRGEQGDRRILIEGKTATIQDHERNPVATAYNVTVDGTFPAWRRVMPNVEKPSSGAYNAEYLAEFGKAAKELTETKQGLISIYGDEGNAAVIRFIDAPYAFGLLFPVRWRDGKGVPDFMNDPEVEKPAQAA